MNNNLVKYSFVFACLVAPWSAWAKPSADYATLYQQAVEDETRPAEAIARDVYRKPEQVLAFSQLAPGDTVVEIASSRGYYTAILSRVVGAEGRIFGIDPERLFETFPQGRKGFPAYIAQDPRANVTYSSQYLDEVTLNDDIDQIWMVLYYHDTLWTGEDRAEMNARFFKALKKGGRYLVIDHHALPGSGAEVGRTLHRMDRQVAITEIEAAGFKLVAQSAALENEIDPLTDSVFAEHRRGNTHRFMLLFEKP